MMTYRAAIHAVNNYYYVECKSKEEAEQIIRGWKGQIDKSDDPYLFLEFKPFCYVRFDQVVGIELVEWDDSFAPICKACCDDEQTTLDRYLSLDGDDSSSTTTEPAKEQGE